MKKLYTLLFAMILISSASFAQKGLNIGINGSYNAVTIVNQNTWGASNSNIDGVQEKVQEYDYDLTFGTGFGLDVGYNFTDDLGIYSGFRTMTMGNDYHDSYKWKGTESKFDRSVKLNYNIIPITFKFTGSQSTVNFIGGIGVLIAMLNEAEQTWTIDGSQYTESYFNDATDETYDVAATDVTNRFNSTDIILNLELGARIFLIDNLYIDATMNFGYGVKDINHEDWQMKNADGEYKASHNAFAGAKIGIAYVLFGEY